MVSAPGYECPVCAMPEANEHHHNKHVAIQHEPPFSPPAEWHEHIVTHPCGQRDMPPLPEVRRVSGQEWAREIKRKLKPEQLGATTSDVGVTRKIEEHLHKKGETARPRSQPTRMRRRIVEVRIGYHGEPVREHHLLYQA